MQDSSVEEYYCGRIRSRCIRRGLNQVSQTRNTAQDLGLLSEVKTLADKSSRLFGEDKSISSKSIEKLANMLSVRGFKEFDEQGMSKTQEQESDKEIYLNRTRFWFRADVVDSILDMDSSDIFDAIGLALEQTEKEFDKIILGSSFLCLRERSQL